MKRTADLTASSLDFSSNCAYPPTTSLASVKGPSITETFPPESRTRAPSAVGPSPPLPTIVPAFSASWLRLPMASINSLGGKPDLSADLTIIMNRMVISPFRFELRADFPDCIRRLNLGSTYASNEVPGNRRGRTIFLQDRGAPRLRLRGLPLQLVAQLLLSRGVFGRKNLRREIGGLEHLANLDLGFAFKGVRAALDPFDGLFLGLYLQQPEAADQFLRFGKGSVNHSAGCSRELDARALGTR